jgi:uncharacterized protein YjbI with pentapeptide repeats
VSNKDTSILREVRAEDLVRTLTMQTTHTRAPLLPLDNAKVVGKLDLRHLTIEKPVEIRGCEFEGEVDLRYCDFRGTVDFSRCTFNREFNCGDEPGSRAIYGKSLTCDQVLFKAGAKFNSTRIEGSASFHASVFESTPQSELAMDFTSASVDGPLDCREVLFKGPVSFANLSCNGNLVFHKARFEGVADFSGATFAGSFYCDGGDFSKETSFNAIRCLYGGVFDYALFQGEVDFTSASIGGSLYCGQATFREGVHFDTLQCGRNASFDGASLEEVSFDRASFDGSLYCRNASFEGEANFNLLKCGGDGGFDDAYFGEAVSFTYASLGDHLLFQNARFGGAVDLAAAQISQDLVFTGSRFEGKVSFSGATARRLVLDSSVPDPSVTEQPFPFSENSLNLRGFTFKDYAGTKAQATRLANTQDRATFSMDPYLQLEELYRSSGDEVDARKIYYAGRCAFRKNAKDEHGSTKWPKPRKWRDWWLKWLTGYGVKAWRAILPMVALVIFGMFVFLPNDALEVEGSSTPGRLKIENPSTPTPGGETFIVSALPNKQNQETAVSHLWERFAYSADLALPTISLQGVSLLELNAARGLVPHGLVPEVYAVFHQIAGQLLILLFIATLLGYTRRW